MIFFYDRGKPSKGTNPPSGWLCGILTTLKKAFFISCCDILGPLFSITLEVCLLSSNTISLQQASSSITFPFLFFSHYWTNETIQRSPFFRAFQHWYTKLSTITLGAPQAIQGKCLLAALNKRELASLTVTSQTLIIHKHCIY